MRRARFTRPSIRSRTREEYGSPVRARCATAKLKAGQNGCYKCRAGPPLVLQPVRGACRPRAPDASRVHEGEFEFMRIQRTLNRPQSHSSEAYRTELSIRSQPLSYIDPLGLNQMAWTMSLAS
jgi:hypothetical protein